MWLKGAKTATSEATSAEEKRMKTGVSYVWRKAVKAAQTEQADSRAVWAIAP